MAGLGLSQPFTEDPLAIDDAPHAYLVVASLEPGTAVRPIRMAVARLIRHLRPNGAYSISVSRQQELALLCGFELEADAAKLSAAVRAKPIGRYAGWRSQRGFMLDKGKHEAILRLLSTKPA